MDIALSLSPVLFGKLITAFQQVSTSMETASQETWVPSHAMAGDLIIKSGQIVQRSSVQNAALIVAQMVWDVNQYVSSVDSCNASFML